MSYDQKKPGQSDTDHSKDKTNPSMGGQQKKPQGQGGHDQRQPTGGGSTSQKPAWNPTQGGDYNKSHK